MPGPDAPARRISCGEAIISSLVDNGVDTVFGIPGTHNLEIYAHLATSPIRHVTPRHEQGAGYGADGYARSSGRPGVCIVTTGPGLTNVMTAAATAYHDSIPILIISPGMPTDVEGQDLGYLHQVKNQQRAMDSVVAWSRRVESAAEAAKAIADAFAHFASERPRPVHVEIPLDVLETDTTDGDALRVHHAPRPAPEHDQVASAAKALMAARSPAMLVGGGARAATAQVRRMAELLGSPVVTTVNGKGVVPETHQLSLGASLRLPAARRFLEASDMVLAVGTEIAESDLWVRSLDFSGEVVRVDIDPAQLQKNARSRTPVLGDAALALDALTEAIGWRPALAAPDGPVRATRIRFEIERELPLDAAPFFELHDVLRSTLPEDAIVAGDSAQVSYYGTAHLFPVQRPGQFLYPTGYATLGYGLPAAIGAQLANPDRQVVVLVGDGGFMFSANELATLAELGFSIPIVILNNGGYGEIKGEMLQRRIEPIAVDLVSPDFVKLAEAFGLDGVSLAGTIGFRDALARALANPRATLIEVRANGPDGK